MTKQKYFWLFLICNLITNALFGANNNPSIYKNIPGYENIPNHYCFYTLEDLQNMYPLNPNNTEIIVALARAYSKQLKYAPAIELFTRACQLNPTNYMLLLELGNTYGTNNQNADALQIYYKILEMLPDDVAILYNIALTLTKLGLINQSMLYYHRTLELDPDYVEAHFTLGTTYLLCGDYENGWREYEWRWKRNSHQQPVFNKPPWDGYSDLRGKTIFLHAEQGFGDTFQFIRYARVAKRRGARVIAGVQDELTTILSLCPYIDQVIGYSHPLPPFDLHAPLMSMPALLHTDLDTVPNQMPYLYADQLLTTQWKEKLAHDHNFKIGICYHGSSTYNTQILQALVASKSLHISSFLPLLEIPGVTVYNLQKESAQEQILEFDHKNLINFDADFDNKNGRFMDTAALMKNLDLVITIDTSICHLAGGLGVPVWNLLPNSPDWRWMLKRTDTPWYPTMRLFRQPAPGDWQSVINQVVTELKKIVH